MNTKRNKSIWPVSLFCIKLHIYVTCILTVLVRIMFEIRCDIVTFKQKCFTSNHFAKVCKTQIKRLIQEQLMANWPDVK